MRGRQQPAQREIPRGFALVLVGLLTIAYVAPYAYAALPGDTVRDLLVARAIAQGERFPLVGPPINFSVHLGPVWWYLEALPLLVTGTTAGAMMFAGVLAAAKFPLAYACGSHLASRRFGLCFAASLALPSVAIFQWMLPMHPALVEAALLLSLACALRGASGGDLRWAYAAALALGLAIQFHPTALFYAPLLALWLLLRVGVPLRQRIIHAFGAMVVASAWFWPALASDVLAVRHEPWSTQSDGVADGKSFASVLAVARSLFVELPLAVAGSHLSKSGTASIGAIGSLLTIGTALAAGLSLVIARGDRSTRFRVTAVLALLAAAIAIVSTIRIYVSFYTTYFLLPMAAFVAAASLDALLGARTAAWRLVGVMGVTAIVVVHIVASRHAVDHGRNAFLRSAVPSLGDLRNGRAEIITASTYPVATRDAVGKNLCALGDAVTLHGDLGYGVASSYSLDTLLACGKALRPTIAGREPADRDAHLVGLSRGALRRLDRVPQDWFGRYGIVRPLAVAHPPQGHRVESEFAYFEQALDRGRPERLTIGLQAPGPAIVAIYNYKPFDSRLVVRVTADGVPAEPVLQTVQARYYRMRAGAPQTIAWTIDIETDVPRWIDVFAF